MVEVTWAVSENPPFYKKEKLMHSVFADAQEVTEWLEEMYQAHDGFLVVSMVQ